MDPVRFEENPPRIVDDRVKLGYRRNRRAPNSAGGVTLRIADDTVCPALAVKRHLEILHLLCLRGELTVREVANHFQISVDTARRDLDLLARQGQLRRAYGGAVAIEKPAPQGRKRMPQVSRHPFEGAGLARSLDRLIKDGETLLLNAGSATRCCIEALACRNVRMVTNSLDLPFELVSGADLYVLGGKCRPDARLTVGPMTISGINVTVDSTVIGLDGITAKEGLTANRPDEAFMAAEMMAAAQRTIVIADSSKLGKRSFARIGPIESMQVLITDKEPLADLTQALHEARVEVIIVAPQEVDSSFDGK
jgi:DeoR family fructose operon transcriptional repressor